MKNQEHSQRCWRPALVRGCEVLEMDSWRQIPHWWLKCGEIWIWFLEIHWTVSSDSSAESWMRRWEEKNWQMTWGQQRQVESLEVCLQTSSACLKIWGVMKDIQGALRKVLTSLLRRVLDGLWCSPAARNLSVFLIYPFNYLLSLSSHWSSYSPVLLYTSFLYASLSLSISSPFFFFLIWSQLPFFSFFLFILHSLFQFFLFFHLV